MTSEQVQGTPPPEPAPSPSPIVEKEKEKIEEKPKPRPKPRKHKHKHSSRPDGPSPNCYDRIEGIICLNGKDCAAIGTFCKKVIEVTSSHVYLGE